MTIFLIAIMLALVPLGFIWPRVDAALLVLVALLALAYAHDAGPSAEVAVEASARHALHMPRGPAGPTP